MQTSMPDYTRELEFGIATAIEGAIAHNWYFIVSSAVLLAGGAAVAAAIARMDDRAFAGR